MADQPENSLLSQTESIASKPLHQTVAQRLRRRLTTGDIPDGGKLPPLREIAEEFRVSTMTVRQAIRTLEEEGRIYRIAGVGAFVKPAPPPATAAQKMLAFVVMDLASSFDQHMACGVERACQQRGWALQILDAHLDVELEAGNLLRLPRSGSRAAIILPPWNPANIDTLFRIQSPSFPIVLLDREVPGLQADLVASNHEQGGFLATNHFIEQGHSRILMITHKPHASSIVGRIAGYQRALRMHGIEIDSESIVWIDRAMQDRGYKEQTRWLGGYEAALAALRAIQTPVAVLAIDAYAAWGVYEACRELGLRIPDDVSLIGFDDSEIAGFMDPPMTIVAQRTEDIGAAAVGLLEQRLSVTKNPPSGHRQNSQILVDMDLIERGSVGRVQD